MTFSYEGISNVLVNGTRLMIDSFKTIIQVALKDWGVTNEAGVSGVSGAPSSSAALSWHPGAGEEEGAGIPPEEDTTKAAPVGWSDRGQGLPRWW